MKLKGSMKLVYRIIFFIGVGIAICGTIQGNDMILTWMVAYFAATWAKLEELKK
jgi:hypothetical protein